MSEPCRTCDRDRCRTVSVIVLINLLLHEEDCAGRGTMKAVSGGFVFKVVTIKAGRNIKGVPHTSITGINKHSSPVTL